MADEFTMKLKEVACYNCGEKESQPYDTENGFHLVKCVSCGLVYLSPRPSENEITSATKTGQHRGDELIDTTGLFSEAKIPRYLSLLGDFFPQRFSQQRTWLDIGCGFGEFLESLTRFFGASIDVRGCEPNQAKIASAQSRGLNVDFFDLATHDQQYDYVSMLNVFSHLPDPIETLSEWKSLIAPGGYIFLETGHSSHLTAKDHHKPYYVPDHLSFANQEIVEGILRRIGFRIEKTMIYRHTVFPPISLKDVVRQSIKFAIRRPNHLRSMFPRHPNRDMFILAQRD